MRFFAMRIGAVSAIAAFLAAGAAAQNAPAPAPAAPAAAPAATSQPADVFIDFEDLAGFDGDSGGAVADRYRANYGVRFGLGAIALICNASSPEDAAARGLACPYPRGASGVKVVYFNQQADELDVAFEQAPATVSFAINPTGGALGETYQVVITAFDPSDALIGRTTTDAVWDQAAFTWPTRVSFSGGGRPIGRILVATSRGRFFLDDLRLGYGAPSSRAYEDLVAVAAAPPLRDPTPVAAANADRGLRLYKSTPRVRTSIDWTAAFAARDAQRAAGAVEPKIVDSAGLNAALLPVLAPFSIDRGELDVASVGDTYSASYAIDGRRFISSGSRVLVKMPDAAESGPPQNLQFASLEYGMAASFALYGAAYEVTRLCTEAEISSGALCYDEGAMREALKTLDVLIGSAGEARP